MALTLDKLPNEIIQEIAHLTGNDVKDLRQVNKHVHGVVDSVMWDTHPVILHLNRENLDLGMSMLDYFNKNPVQHIQKLEIKSLDPTKERNPPERYMAANGDGSFTTHPPMPEDTEEIIEARKKLFDVLPGALSASKGLKSVRWSITRMDPKGIQPLVLKSLGSLPLLSDFQVLCGESMLPLHHLGNGTLRRLSVTLAGDLQNEEEFIPSLQAVLLHNPHLVDLDLDKRRSWKELPFQDMFRDIPKHSLKLQTLLVHGWSVEVTPQLLSPLQSLRSLSLRSNWSINQSVFWKSLRPYTLRVLRFITVDQVSDDFLSYLETSPALEELNIYWAGARTDADSDRLAQRFYRDVLPRHRETVRKLVVDPSLTGMWTIGLNNMDRFEGCNKLVHLTVGPDPNQIEPGGKEKDIIYSLVSYVASNLPEVSVLFLSTVSPKGYRNARCGTGRYAARQRISKGIADALEKASYPRERLTAQLSPGFY